MGIDKEFQNQYWKAHEQSSEFRHRACLDFIANKGSILDLGCGDGHLLAKLKDQGFTSLAGLDISEVAVEKAKTMGLDAKVFDFFADKLPYPDDSFDYVVLLDVLEHLFQPADILQEAARVSKKYILISVPNFNSLPVRLQVLCGKVPENNRPGKGHIYWFNYQALKNIFKQNNLEIVELRVNTFWENKFLIKYLLIILKRLFPKLFGLSFLIKVKKIHAR
jgi:methionine biosynthesis protein MetW